MNLVQLLTLLALLVVLVLASLSLHKVSKKTCRQNYTPRKGDNRVLESRSFLHGTTPYNVVGTEAQFKCLENTCWTPQGQFDGCDTQNITDCGLVMKAEFNNRKHFF